MSAESVLQLEAAIRLGCFLAVFLSVWGWETAAPRRARTAQHWLRWVNNLAVAVVNGLCLRLLFPLIATPVAMSLVWSMLMNPMMGQLNWYLSLFGIGPSNWAADSATVMPSLIMIEIWHWTPMTMLVLLAGLKSLPTVTT